METSPARAPQHEGPEAALWPPLAVLLREGFRWFMERLNEDADAGGDPRLSAGAAVVVSHLRPQGVRAAEIARTMGVTRQHVHAVVRELTDAGVVRSVPDPASRRDRLIVPTEAGEARRRRAVARLAALEDELAGSVGRADLETLHGILERLWDPRADRVPDAPPRAGPAAGVSSADPPRAPRRAPTR